MWRSSRPSRRSRSRSPVRRSRPWVRRSLSQDPNFPTKVGPVSITLKTLNTDDAVGRISVFAPEGYQLRPGGTGVEGRHGHRRRLARRPDRPGRDVEGHPDGDRPGRREGHERERVVRQHRALARLDDEAQRRRPDVDVPVFVDQTSGTEATFSSFRDRHVLQGARRAGGDAEPLHRRRPLHRARHLVQPDHQPDRRAASTGGARCGRRSRRRPARSPRPACARRRRSCGCRRRCR